MKLKFGFNGAALFTGRRELTTTHQLTTPTNQASMGPPFLSSGERGRDAPCRLPCGCKDEQASMGPPFLPGGERAYT